MTASGRAAPVAGAGAWVVQVAVKQLVERPRPPAGLALSHATGFAFPSGHATDAAAVYGMLAVLLAAPAGGPPGWLPGPGHRTDRPGRAVTAVPGCALVERRGRGRRPRYRLAAGDVHRRQGRRASPQRRRWMLLAAVLALVLMAPEAVEGLGAPVHAAVAPVDHPARKVPGGRRRG